MAVKTTGYYGLGTAKRDFGMKTNMTLPVVLTPDLPDDNTNKRRLKLGESSSKPSWKKRLSGMFQRNKHGEVEEAKKREQPPAKPVQAPAAIEASVEDEQEPTVDEGPIILTIKPVDATPDKKNRYVTLQPQKGHNLGIKLSGGGPPITVTHIEPGGVAEKAGLRFGDTVLEVNGHDCRKNTDILHVTELKMLIQQASVDSDEEFDEDAWAFIKAKQGELESSESSKEASNTSLGQEDDIPRVKSKIKIDEDNEPLPPATVEDEPPVEEPKAESPPKAKKKKKKEASSEPTVPDPTSEKKKKKRKSALIEQKESPEEQPKSVETNGKKKKKKAKEQPEGEPPVSPPPSAVEAESKKKKRKSTLDATPKQPEDTASASPADTKSKKKRKSKIIEAKIEEKADSPPPAPAPAVMPQAEPDEKKETKKKKKTKAAASSPPPQTEASPSPPAAAVEEVDTPEKITIAVISKKGKKAKKVKDRSELYRVKDEETDTKTPTKEAKKKKKKTDKKVKDATLEKSDDLVFVSAHVETRKPPSTEVKRKGKKASSSRRMSQDQGGNDEIDFSPISSDHRSTSYTEDLSREQKQFRSELRQASKSQYDMAASSPENTLVMKKSGVVMKKKGTLPRPTIFGHSSSPEPDEDELEKAAAKETTISDSTPVETTPAAASPTTDTSTPVKATKGSKAKDKPKKKKKEKSGKKVKKASTVSMDLSDIPITPPSLGLAHGHDKLDLINRSSSMSSRRPAKMRKHHSTEDEMMGTKRVDLGSSLEETPKRRRDVKSATLPINYKEEFKQPDEEEEEQEEDDEDVSGNLILSAHKKQVISGNTRSGQRRSSADIAKAAVSVIQQKQEEERQQEKPISRSLFPEESSQPSKRDQFAATTNLSSKSAVFEKEDNSLQRRLSRDKSVEKPTKTLELVGMFSQTNNNTDDHVHKRIKSVDKPVKTLGIASENSSQPAWVAIAQGRSKRSSASFDDSPTKPQPSPGLAAAAASPSTQPEPKLPLPTKPTITTPSVAFPQPKKPLPQQMSGQALLPKAGTVRERMAMFQQGK